jgi:hypothetical protein
MYAFTVAEGTIIDDTLNVESIACDPAGDCEPDVQPRAINVTSGSRHVRSVEKPRALRRRVRIWFVGEWPTWLAE